MTATPPSSRIPHVAVLLATYNGRRWLPEQLETILNQDGVTVEVIALDDGSVDGTRAWLEERAVQEPRITVLASDTRSGSASANFYRLIERADVGTADFIAFADQDDIWLPTKLAGHAATLERQRCDGLSSSVTSFTSTGVRRLIKKDYPQRRWDFLTESPGPGCTFLLTPRLFHLVRHALETVPATREADFHDSLIYAIGRSRGWRWHIDPAPSVEYRQHDSNVLGANLGGRSALARLRMIGSRWHRDQAIVHARVGLHVAPPRGRAELQRVLALLADRGLCARLRLAADAGRLRRRPRDRFILQLLIAVGIW